MDATPPLDKDKDEITELMGILGSLLFLGRAIDNNLLKSLIKLDAAQEKGTKATKEASKKLLNY